MTEINNQYLISKGRDGILLRFLSDYLENTEHHPLVMGYDTLTPKDIRLSNIQQTTRHFIAYPLIDEKS